MLSGAAAEAIGNCGLRHNANSGGAADDSPARQCRVGDA
jgi:hypothetical protein